MSELKGNKPVLGSPTAKVLVVEFTDFQCPFCKKYGLNTFPQVREQLIEKGKVQYVVRDFPLGFHDKAKLASLAANCAGKQNAYWDMKQRLLGGQENLDKPFYVEQSQALKLNQEKFTACMDSKDMLAAIDKDVAYANEVGVQATPTFLVGRIEGGNVTDIKAVSGAMAFESFVQTVESVAKPR
jgi:protein-disulfide isomerase